MMNDVCLDFYTNTLPYLHSDAIGPTRIAYLAYAIALYLFTIVSLCIFLYMKDRIIYAKQKNTLSVLLLSLGMLLAVSINILREYIGRDRYPCLLVVLIYHIPMLWFASQPIGILYFYIYKLRMERIKTQSIKRLFNDDVDDRSQSSFDAAPAMLLHNETRKRYATTTTSSFSHVVNEIGDFICVWRHSKNGQIVVGTTTTTVIAGGEGAINEEMQSKKDDIVIGIDVRPQTSTLESSSQIGLATYQQFILEQIGIPLMMMIAFGFHYILAIVLRASLDPLATNGCHGCNLTHVDFLLKAICGAIYLPIAIVPIYAMRNEQDPLGIFREFKIAIGFGMLCVVCWLINAILSLLGENEMAVVHAVDLIGVTGVYYAFVLDGIFKGLIEKRRAHVYPNGRKRFKAVSILSSSGGRDYSSKNLPPPSALDLNRILVEPKARNAFLEHSINEISSENVVFVFKLRAWKSIWDRERPEKITKIALQLFKEYISKESKSPINISHSLSSKVEEEIAPFMVYRGNMSVITQSAVDDTDERKSTLNSMKPSKEIFDDCEKECVLMLEHDALPRFCQSELFKTEIIEAGILKKVLKQS